MKANFAGRTVAAVAAALVLFAAGALAADTDAAKVLAPSGKLRAALYPGTPTSVVDPKESEPRGVGYELGKEIARRLGVPYEPVVHPNNAEVQEAIKTGKHDVAFTNASAARRQIMDFGPTFLLIELGYLVPANSAIPSPADIDQKGRKVGVAAGSTSQSTLSRDLKNAELVPAATNLEGAQMVAAGKIDAFATNKATLFELAEKVPGLKVLSGRWGEEHFAIGFPKGREQGAAFMKKFTEDALAEGLVKRAMDRAGLKGALTADTK